MDIDTVYDRLDEAQAALAECHRLIREAGADVVHDTNLQRLRRLQEDIGDLRDRIEDVGLTDDDE